MSLQTTAWGHDGGSYAGKDMRLHTAAIFGAAPGVVGRDDFLVAAQASPGATVQVAAGSAIVVATGSGLMGDYHVWNDATLNSPSFSPTSSQGRKDRLILRVTAGVPALEIVQGTPSATPAEPSITGDNYLELALVTLPASTSNVTNAMLTDRRTRAAAVGGTVICTSSTRPSTPWTGMTAWETDTARQVIYNGSAWVCVTPQSATVAASETTASTSYTNLTTSGPAVTLPTGTKALVTLGADIANSAVANPSVMAVAVSGATTLAAADANGIINLAGYSVTVGRTFLISGLTPGSNTFTAKYKASAGTGTFANRSIAVIGVA